ncbi:MAG: 1-acyl-sn-glycerol-3-phosphate acyltransferase [Gemmatimonadaceae bacterium]|nr:1-acyl-sn-glycerol-3-phosphate acyltransferase [Gemmatimonadaceae bacterium]
MRTLFTLLTIAVATPLLGASVIVGALMRLPDRPGGLFDRVPRAWAWLILKAAGVRVVVHGEDRIAGREANVFAANHVSWFDVFVMAAALRHYKFIAKAELERIPIFGRAVRAAGFIFIDRNNRKAAFAGYEAAADRMRDGFSVIVYPEGTRGASYALRPFKKGPFVLAIAAGAPVVPTIVHGTREVQAAGSFFIRSGVVHLHFLDPVPTAGLSYDDRDRVARLTWDRMAAAMESLHGVRSTAPGPALDSSDIVPLPPDTARPLTHQST